MRINKYAHPPSPTPLSLTKRLSFPTLHVVLEAQLMRLSEKTIEPGLVLIAIEVIIDYFDFMYKVLHQWNKSIIDSLCLWRDFFYLRTADPTMT